MALRAYALALSLCLASAIQPAGAASDEDPDALKLEVEVGVASDYIYRGVSLSERKPSAHASIDVEKNGFYGFVQFAGVSLPNDPAVEITLTGGYRWTFADVDFDFGANYFDYPGQTLAPGAVNLNYWEYALQATHDINGVELQGTFAYSPNVSGTGAWGAYVEGQVTFDLPQLKLWKPIDWHLIASGGYWRFGNISPDLGGFPLPSYVNWQVGLAFDLTDQVTFDVSYYDTNLSRENCFVFTGDPAAILGGVANPVSNPLGLRSRLCGASVVGTLTFDFPDSK